MQDFSDKINQRLSSLSIPAQPARLYQPLGYTLQLGGKRMRPLLTLLGYSLFKNNTDKALNAAAAIELFHNFTLLHDDIMDKAPLRRGKPTVWKRWGNDVAILSGDAMLIKAYQLLAEYEPKTLKKILPIFNSTALKICEGQQLDMDYETSQTVSIDNYLEMIELKTAVLPGAALQIGAIIANAKDKDANLLYQFGKNIGIAFQLHDDILDVFADRKKFGKQQGGDIIANKKTFLLLKTFELADRKTKAELKILLKEKDAKKKVSGMKELYTRFGIKALTENEMRKFYKKALTSLTKINAPEKKKKILIAFAKKLMQREN